MKVNLLLCVAVVIQSRYSLSDYNHLCLTRHGDFLKHPKDCAKFIRCNHGQAYEFQCPANLWWHNEIKTCDYKYSTKCELNIGESSSDTDKAITDINEETMVKFTTDNFSELSTASQETSTVVDEITHNFTTDNVLKPQTTTVDSINKNNLTFTAVNVSESVLELSTESLNNKLFGEITTSGIIELSTTEEIVSLSPQFTKNSIMEIITELSPTEYTSDSIESFFSNITELPSEENTIKSTKQLHDSTTLDYYTDLATEGNALNLTKNIVDNSEEQFLAKNLLNLSAEANKPNLKTQSVNNSNSDYIFELSTAESTTTTEPEIQSTYIGNEAEILKGLIATPVSANTTADKNQTSYAAETTTEIINSNSIEILKKHKDVINYNNENNLETTTNPIFADLATSNNKNDKQLNSNENVFLTTTLMPSYPPLDSSTQDPRLPFRSLECQGNNNRQQLKALKCYQYYQCFAGWAYLLNCHEGWHFQTNMKRCIQDVDNECEYGNENRQ